ncbi:MAG: hypothetical protein V4506_14460 [Bacteroidota bacterium]
MNTQQTIAYYQGLTKRQLFKAYRDAVTHLNECNTVYNTGHDFLHGEPIVQYQRAAQTEWNFIINELHYRYTQQEIDSIPNVDAIIPRFTIDQRREFMRERDARYEKTSLENTIARFKVGAIMRNENRDDRLVVGNWLNEKGEMLIDYLNVYTYSGKPGQQFVAEIFRQENVLNLISENWKIV